MKAEKRYFWKELTDDGLLKDFEPFFNEEWHTEHINPGMSWDEDKDGFASEEDAVARLEEIKVKYEYTAPNSAVLICEYNFNL